MADNKQIALAVLEAVGGTANVTNVTHCMTRLRFNLKDESVPKDDEVKAIAGVLGVVKSGGQYQIVIGQNVPKVYAEVCKAGGFKAQDAIEENLDAPKEKLTAKKIGNNILNYMAGSLTPLIPIILAAGLFKTVLAIFGPDLLGLFTAESDIYILLDFLYDAGFYFLPIFIGYHAAKKLNVTPVLGMYMGAILIAPDFIDLVNSGASFTVLGIPCSLNDYSQSVLPIVLSVWIMSYVEKFFKKFIPDVLATIFVPFLTIAVMTPISLCLLAPFGSVVGSYISMGLIAFGDVGGFVAVALVAAIWEFLVMSGMHMVIIMFMLTTWMETGVMSGVMNSGMFATWATFGVALGAALRIKNKEEKSMTFGFFASGILGGVTEPTLYGLCFNHKKTFIGLMVGGAVGGAYAGITNVQMYLLGSTNFLSLVGFAGGPLSNTINATIACLLSMVVAAVVTFMFGFSKDEECLKK